VARLRPRGVLGAYVGREEGNSDVINKERTAIRKGNGGCSYRFVKGKKRTGKGNRQKEQGQRKTRESKNAPSKTYPVAPIEAKMGGKRVTTGKT